MVWCTICENQNPKIKSRKISFAHYDCAIILKFRNEHGNEIIVFCAKFQSDWAT